MLSNGIHIGRRGGVRLTGGGGEGWPSALRSSLVAFWPLSESSDGSGAVSRADLVGTSTLTDNNTVASATGLVYGNAASFTAANGERLSIADNAALSTGDIDFWLAVWVYPTAHPSAGNVSTLVAKANGPNAQGREYEIHIVGVTGVIEAMVGNTSGLASIANGVATLNQWTLVVLANDAANDLLLCSRNGAAYLSAANVQVADSAHLFSIGSHNTYTRFFTGRIGPVMVGKGYVPTAADVTWLYNSGAGRAY